MKNYKHLKLSTKDKVLTVKLSNPPKHTLNVALLNEMHELLDELEKDNETRVVIVTGEAEGIFLRWFELTEIENVGEQTKKAGEAFLDDEIELTTIQELGCRIEKLPQVTIAAINGYASGGACGLALSFDFRLMMSGDPQYLFGSPQAIFGITTCNAQSVRYVRIMGTARALDLLLHGTLLPPEEALAVGLVSRVYPKETYWQEVAKFAANLAGRAPLAQRGIKKLIRMADDLSFKQALRHEMVEYGKVIFSNDAKKALSAMAAEEHPDPTQIGNFKVDFTGT